MMILNDADKSLYKNVWVIAEVRGGEVLPVTHELLGAARVLADVRGGQVWAVSLGGGASADGLIQFGADTVIAVGGPEFHGFNDELECNVLKRLIEEHKPEIVIGAATARGRALIPRVAVCTYSGLTADCTGLAIDPENGDLLQTRPAFGGNLMATIRTSNHRPQMATVRPMVMKALEPDANRQGEIIRQSARPVDLEGVKKVVAIMRGEDSSINLSDAHIIISGGRAMKGPEGFDLLRRFAELVGGAVGASRAAVDSGWISYAHQVGQTGQTVQTSVYIACGISGQIQHLVGMQSCDTIIAIDKNPDTPMMKLADVAIVGDLYEIVPEIIRQLEAEGK